MNLMKYNFLKVAMYFKQKDTACKISILCFAFLLFLLDVGCPFRFLTGICCPGCGITRAIIHILKLDFDKAIYYHPLVITLPIIAIVILKSKCLNKLFVKTFLIVMIALFVIVYVIRIIDKNNNVVYIDFTKGFIYKLLNKLF